jgi:putative transposase
MRRDPHTGAPDFFGFARDYLHTYMPKTRGLSPKTIEAYRISLECFLDYLAVAEHIGRERVSFDHFDRPHLKGWLIWMTDQRHYTSLGTRACLTKISGCVAEAGGMSRFQLLSDAQWSLIADLLPVPTGKQGRPFRDARQVVEGIIYRYRCGIAWRDVPDVFGPWQTIWTWHRRLSADGTWDLVLARLLASAQADGAIDWAVSVDSTIARAHQHATNLTRLTGGWVELHESRHRAA